MKLNRPTPRQTVYILFGIVLVLAAASTVAGLHTFRHTPTATNKNTGTSAAADKPPDKTSKNKQDDSAKTTNPSNKTDSNSGTDGSAPADSGDITQTSLACSLLTPSIAQEVIGAEAKSSTPADTTSLKTDGTSLEACAYSSTTGSVQLTIRAADNSLGTSKNATIFGSEKPSDAVNLPDYGESAYWDPEARRLNILSSNTWYSIITSSGTQDDAETIASEVAPQL